MKIIKGLTIAIVFLGLIGFMAASLVFIGAFGNYSVTHWRETEPGGVTHKIEVWHNAHIIYMEYYFKTPADDQENVEKRITQDIKNQIDQYKLTVKQLKKQ